MSNFRAKDASTTIGFPSNTSFVAEMDQTGVYEFSQTFGFGTRAQKLQKGPEVPTVRVFLSCCCTFIGRNLDGIAPLPPFCFRSVFVAPREITRRLGWNTVLGDAVGT